jgi:hypothetical protein
MMLNMPKVALAERMLAMPDDGEPIGVNTLVNLIEQMKVDDMLAILQDDPLTNGGQFELMKLAPNFEMAMYLAQATGAQILTDSPFRWRELQAALARRHLGTAPALIQLQREIASSPVYLPVGHQAIFRVFDDPSFRGTEPIFRSAFSYAANRTAENLKPNFEAQLAARFRQQRDSMNSLIDRSKMPAVAARVTTAFRFGGFQDNTINRLLLMSSSEHHLHSVPMATFVERWDPVPRADNTKPRVH